MENKLNYALVGFFVILLTICFFIIIIWLSIGLSSKSYDHYLVFINESVSGLSIKAPVKYNGVNVGYVQSISLNSKNPRQVRLLLSIESDIRITVGTYATLDSQGLTGITYIELTGGTLDEPLLTKSADELYPVIKSEPSLMFRFDLVVDRLSRSMDDITVGIKEVLNSESIHNLNNTLENINKISELIYSESNELRSLIHHMDLTFRHTAEASKNLPELFSDLTLSVKKIDQITTDIHQVGVNANTTFTDSTLMIERMNEQVIPEFLNTVHKFQSALDYFQELSEKLSDNPSILIRGSVPVTPGPGE
jgi:phospholipid/cholesterol/gamma-HCH transport system substrate-binding protein